MSTDNQAAAEDAVATMLFGPEGDQVEPEVTEKVEIPEEETPETEEEFEYEAGQEPTPEGDDTEETQEETDLVEFEFDGQLLEAPVAIKEALMRQQDYTQKTQAVAEDRKTLEVQRGEVEYQQRQVQFVESVQPDLLKAQQLESQAEEAHKYLRDNIDNLSATDIEKIRLGIEDFRKERDDLVQSITNKQTEFQQAQEQAHGELLKKGTEILQQRIPGWGKEAQEQLHEYASAAGFSEAEINSLVDPRQVETLWKASQYDALQSGKAAAVKKVQAAPSIKQKSRNPMPKRTGEKLNLRKKLKSNKISNSDKASLVGEDLAKRFGM